MADIIDFDSFRHQKPSGFQVTLPIMKAFEGLGDYLAMESADLTDVLEALEALNEAITGEDVRLKG